MMQAKRKNQRDMQNPLNLLRVTLQSIRDAVVTTDSSARVEALNPAAEKLTGWSTADAAGKPIEEVIPLYATSGNPPPENPLLQALREGSPIADDRHFLLAARDGRRTAVQVTAAPLEDGCVLILHDVNEAFQLAERISYRAHHDPLTGLPNRILLVDRLEQGTKFSDRNSDQVAVISVDLDNFLEIKETYGNTVSDELLKEAAFRMLAVLRESDTVCRLGADEFVLMVPGVKSVADVESVAAKLLIEIARPLEIGGHTVNTTCSIGISVYPHDASDAGTLMRLADGALHQARQQGRNRYVFARPDSVQV